MPLFVSLSRATSPLLSGVCCKIALLDFGVCANMDDEEKKKEVLVSKLKKEQNNGTGWRALLPSGDQNERERLQCV